MLHVTPWLSRTIISFEKSKQIICVRYNLSSRVVFGCHRIDLVARSHWIFPTCGNTKDPKTYQLARLKTLCVTQPLDVTRNRLRQEAKHLPDGEGYSHSVRPIRMTGDKAPQLAESHDGLNHNERTARYTYRSHSQPTWRPVRPCYQDLTSFNKAYITTKLLGTHI